MYSRRTTIDQRIHARVKAYQPKQRLSEQGKMREAAILVWLPELVAISVATGVAITVTAWALLIAAGIGVRIGISELRRLRANNIVTEAVTRRTDELRAARQADPLKFDLLRAIDAAHPVRATAVRVDEVAA